MSAVAAVVLLVPGLLLCAVGTLWLCAPARTVDAALGWAARHTEKEPEPPEGAATAARGLGAVLLLTGVLLFVRAALAL